MNHCSPLFNNSAKYLGHQVTTWLVKELFVTREKQHNRISHLLSSILLKIIRSGIKPVVTETEPLNLCVIIKANTSTPIVHEVWKSCTSYKIHVSLRLLNEDIRYYLSCCYTSLFKWLKCPQIFVLYSWVKKTVGFLKLPFKFTS